MKSIFEENGGTYSLGKDGIYYPDLVYSELEEPGYGKYGMLRKTFLKEHRKGLYTTLLLSGKLTAHLNQIDETAKTRMEFMIQKYQKERNVTEEMKELDEIEWMKAMNDIQKSAEEIVLNELIYS